MTVLISQFIQVIIGENGIIAALAIPIHQIILNSLASIAIFIMRII
jgi:hypothetical protein